MQDMEIRQELYDKMQNEYNEYLNELKNSDAQNIINNAYQITMKEEIVSFFYPELEKYDIEDIRALNKTKNPLEELYQGWMDSDAGIHSVLEDSVDYTIEDLKKEQKEKQKKSMER